MKERSKCRRRRSSSVFSFLSLSLSAPSSQLAAPLAREMSDLKVCLLCASMQIRRVPNLGRMNNYPVVCATAKVGQCGQISATGCNNQTFPKFYLHSLGFLWVNLGPGLCSAPVLGLGLCCCGFFLNRWQSEGCRFQSQPLCQLSCL